MLLQQTFEKSTELLRLRSIQEDTNNLILISIVISVVTLIIGVYFLTKKSN